MLKSEPSFASLLVKQSPGMHYGHGWIAGKDGKRWHPSRSQADLLAGHLTQKQGESWLSKLFPQLFR
ncbi:phage filamentation protein Fil family protein [Klebsiella aerogenes]